MNRRGVGLLAAAGLAAAAGTAAFVRLRAVEAAVALPSAPAKQGEFLVLVRCRGELKARRSIQIVAPNNVPDLRIVWQAEAGTVVKQGEPVIRFDPSTAQRNLKEKEAALAQAQATLDQAVAQAGVTAEQDKLDLAGTTYQVERAKLDVAKAEIESKLKGEESQVDLSLAQSKHRVQAAKVNLDQASDEAKIKSLERQRDKAKDEMELWKERLALMELRAPLTGLIQYLSNFAQGWNNAKPFKVGDSVWSGAALAEMPDLTTLELEGKIEEIDRGKIVLDQDVRIRVDSLPESTFGAKLTNLSPMTVVSFEWPPTRTFRGSARMENPDSRLRPSMNGQMDIVVSRIASAISVPSKALFTRNGKPVVYAATGRGYKAVEVEVLARNPDEVAVKGLAAGTQVALVEPDQTKGPLS
jgi:HlyD family secretion protein